MKIFSPHRRKKEAASRRFGGREFQNKIKQAQGYKRVFDPRTKGAIAKVLHWLRLDSLPVQIAVVIVVGLFTYFFCISPYFMVTEIAVAGTERVSSDSVRETLRKNMEGNWLVIPKSHFLLLSKSRAEGQLTGELPLIKEVVGFRRVWPNKIEVEVVERRPGFAFIVDGKNYLVDEEGVVVRELPDTAGFIAITDQVSEPVQIGERLNNAKLVGFILSVIKAWPSKLNSQIKEAKVPGKAATQIQFVSQEGWGVFFDIARPAEAQLSSLSLILNRQIPAQKRLSLAYVDLRFDKWAYYCYKDAPCQAQQQPKAEESLAAPSAQTQGTTTQTPPAQQPATKPPATQPTATHPATTPQTQPE
jgi:cell division septal protein FtsQ